MKEELYYLQYGFVYNNRFKKQGGFLGEISTSKNITGMAGYKACPTIQIPIERINKIGHIITWNNDHTNWKMDIKHPNKP